MSLLRVIEWMTDSADQRQLRMVSILANALLHDIVGVVTTKAPDAPTPAPPPSTPPPQVNHVGIVNDAYKRASAVVRKRKAKARTAKRTKRTKKRRGLRVGIFADPNGTRAKVWEAMTQSSGALSARDLSEVLELPFKAVSNALSNFWLTPKYRRYLERVSQSRFDKNGTVTGHHFLYTYKG